MGGFDLVNRASTTVNRFVVLTHTMPVEDPRPTHWDLMLEQSGVLRTWALDAEPNVQTPIAARQLADHRLHYLDYEGPISGGRGMVSRWDAGPYDQLTENDRELVVRLKGSRLIGRATLRRDAHDPQRWTFSLAAASAAG